MLDWNRRLGAGLLTSTAGMKLKVLEMHLRLVLVHQLVQEAVGNVRSLRRARDLKVEKVGGRRSRT